jgi:hypothetical protein
VDHNGSDRLYEFNPATDSYKSWLPDIIPLQKMLLFAKQLPLIKDDNIWLATDDGVKYFNRMTNQFSSFNNGIKKELEHVPAVELKFDSFGTLWIGTNADGLIRNENRPQLKSYTYNKADKNSITPGWASAVYEATDGKIWILTTGSGASGINILDTRTGQVQQARSSTLSVKNPAIFSIWENSPGEFYLGTFNGIYALSDKTYNIKPVTLPGVPNPVFVRSHFTDSGEMNGFVLLWECINGTAPPYNLNNMISARFMGEIWPAIQSLIVYEGKTMAYGCLLITGCTCMIIKPAA